MDPCIKSVLTSLEDKSFLSHLHQNGYLKEGGEVVEEELHKVCPNKGPGGKIVFKGSIYERAAVPSRLYHPSAECFNQQRSDLDVLFILRNVQASFGDGADMEDSFWLKLVQLEDDGLQEFAKVIPMIGKRKISPPIDSGSAVMFLKESVGDVFVDPQYLNNSKETFLAEDEVMVPRRRLIVGGVKDSEVQDIKFISYFANLKKKMADTVQIKIVGPAVNVKIEEKEGNTALLDMDFIVGFPTEFPPMIRSEFLNRKRSGWLSLSQVKFMIDRGVFITTKYARGECNDTWRYCFSNQYNYLSLRTPERYKNLLRGLRYVYKVWLHPLGSGLTSHHMKTLFLWYMEEAFDGQSWPITSDDEIFNQLLLYVCHHLETSDIPHYFIKDLNLAKHSLKVRERDVPLQFVGSKFRELLKEKHCFEDFLLDEDLATSRTLQIRKKWTPRCRVYNLFGDSVTIWKIVVSHRIIIAWKQKLSPRSIQM